LTKGAEAVNKLLEGAEQAGEVAEVPIAIKEALSSEAKPEKPHDTAYVDPHYGDTLTHKQLNDGKYMYKLDKKHPPYHCSSCEGTSLGKEFNVVIK
jgi:hypothetical protein